MANITVQSPINGWLTRIESSRRDLITVAQSGNRIASAFAMADARVELIETLKDEDIRARLLRMTDPSIAMVELANNPSDEDRIRVCAIAILSGFCPGEEQFAIFGAGRNKDGTPKAGKLYTKEAGFRILFAHLGIVPEVRTTHPEYIKFGTAGKSIWRVGGSASCTYRGDEYKVECAGDVSLGIPGYESDNVAGIAAKARRRMLQALWSKVSPILTTDHADDEDYDDPDTQPVAIANVSRVIEAPHVETKPEPVADELTLPFTTQIEQATGSRQLDSIARAVVAANLSEDETAFYKTMVTEARERLKGTK
jgi:hypothetical protein